MRVCPTLLCVGVCFWCVLRRLGSYQLKAAFGQASLANWLSERIRHCHYGKLNPVFFAVSCHCMGLSACLTFTAVKVFTLIIMSFIVWRSRRNVILGQIAHLLPWIRRTCVFLSTKWTRQVEGMRNQ